MKKNKTLIISLCVLSVLGFGTYIGTLFLAPEATGTGANAPEAPQVPQMPPQAPKPMPLPQPMPMPAPEAPQMPPQAPQEQPKPTEAPQVPPVQQPVPKPPQEQPMPPKKIKIDMDTSTIFPRYQNRIIIRKINNVNQLINLKVTHSSIYDLQAWLLTGTKEVYISCNIHVKDYDAWVKVSADNADDVFINVIYRDYA